MMTILIVGFIFFGEALSIIAELVASKEAGAAREHFYSTWLHMFLLITLAGAFLVSGYMLGYPHLKNIWVITALSIGSILVVEPLLATLMFGQIPTSGAAIGLLFGVCGIIAALAF